MLSRIVLRPIGIAVAVVCCALALGSCEDDGSGPPRVATTVVLLEGNGQQAQVGATLPIELVARATDGRGRPVAGQAVTWSVASGGGSLANASAKTDADGLARATWTLGTVAGQQTVSVRAGSAPAATFTATALAGPAQSLAIVPAAVALDAIGATQALAVSAADAYGNEITGRPVTWVSLDEAVAVVSAAGVVQAVGNGATKVRATLDGATAEADVVVAQVAALILVEPVAPVLAALGETVQSTVTAPGDVIFLHSGASAYDGGLQLQDDQSVIGQGATVPLATAAGLTVPPHSTLPATGAARPEFEGSIAVAQNNTLRGFDFIEALGIAIAGGNFGALAISEMDLSVAAHALFLSEGTLAATFGELTITNGGF